MFPAVTYFLFVSQIPIEPLFKSCLRMVQAITAKGTLSDDSRLMAEDVIDIFIKQVEHP